MFASIRRSSAVIAISILAPALAASAGAQEAPRAPKAGMAIRFQTPGGESTEAFWVRHDSAYAWIVHRGTAAPDTISVPLADLSRLEGVIGSRSRARRGAIIGGAIGLILGGGLMLTAEDYFTGGEMVKGVLFTSALGAGLGALVGLAAPARVWAPLQPSPAR